MKVSLNWLKDYLNLDNYTENELFDIISHHMTEIEAAYKLADASNMTIGYVKECFAHPDSDHLHVCQIEIKPGEVSQIVCGAPNMRQGIKVIVALPGAVLPGDFKIKPSKIRGVESNGMCCSLQELGIEDKYVEDEFKDGIYILPDDAQVGGNPLDALYFNDYVYDLDLTSNRSDLLSVEGTAYDLGASINQKVCIPTFKLEEISEVNPMSVEVLTKKCPKYLTRVVKNVKIKSSPEFIKARLIACGIRPINNVVDITNYVLLQLGQPLHSFDYDKLGNKIVVREAKDKEIIVTLDGEERTLEQGDIVISNGDTPLCVAGVMGGQSTEITSETTNVVLEAAYFEPLSIRKTSQRLQLKSESSTRFERIIDYTRVNRALDYAAYLLTLYAGGKVLSNVNGVEEPYVSKTTSISTNQINKILGTSLTNQEIEQIFDRLGYDFEGEGEYTIVLPSRRMDLLDSYQDVVEDVARMYGYDNIPTILASTNDKGALTEYQKSIRNIRLILSNMGLNEAVTYSLVNEKNLNDFTKEEKEPIKLLMPMTEDRGVMRQSLVSSLLDVIVYNKSRKVNDLAFFEIGKVYSANGEYNVLSGALTGVFTSSLWQGKKTVVDFFLLKGILEVLFEKLNVTATYELCTNMKNMHPGRTANILVDGNYVGFLGEVHPRYAKETDTKGAYVFELLVDEILKLSNKEFKYESLCKFPTVSRDLAIVVDKKVTCKEIIDVIKMTSRKYLVDLSVFDLYEGENISPTEKSLAISLTLQDKEKTLETADVDKIIKSVLNRLDALLGAHLR